MQIFDFSPNAGQPAAPGAIKRFSLVLKYGSDWTAEMEAQVKILDLLSKYLDDRYCLLRNVSLPDLDVPIPFILIGPPGIQMIYATSVRGIYRAQGDTWSVVDSHRRFRPATPNLLIRSSLMARAIEVHLNHRGYQAAKVNPVLVSTKSGLYVEAIRPTVRIVMSDAVDRYIAGLQQDQMVYTRPDVESLVDILTTKQEMKAAQPEPTPAPVVEAYVPQAPAEETPEWMEDRIAALEETPEDELAEEAGAVLTDEEAISEAKAEWVAEDITAQQETPLNWPVIPEPVTLPETPAEAVPADVVESSPEPRKGLLSSFTRSQVTILALLVVLILAVLGAAVYLWMTNS